MSGRDVPKHAVEFHGGALIVGEHATTFTVWHGERAPVVIAAAGGTSLVTATSRQLERDAHDLSHWTPEPWPIAGDVDVSLYADVDVRRTITSWARALARAALLLLEEPLPPRARHVLKLAAVARVPKLALLAVGDDDEREMRTFIAKWNDPAARLDPNDAIAIPKPGASILSALASATAPRSLPDGPLVEAMALAHGQAPPPEGSALFTGRCVVEPGAWAFAGGSAANRVSLRNGVAVLPPPNGGVAFLDEKNDLVAVRKLKLADAKAATR